MNRLSERSLRELKDVDVKIGLVVGMVLSRGKVDLTITDGFRTAEEQLQHYNNGKSRCDGTRVKSYHQSGLAIDFIPCPFTSWEDKESFARVHEELRYCAGVLGFSVGDIIGWDLNHFELREV